MYVRGREREERIAQYGLIARTADVGLAPRRGVLLGNVCRHEGIDIAFAAVRGEGDKPIAPAQLYLDNATCVWGEAGRVRTACQCRDQLALSKHTTSPRKTHTQ